MRPRVFPAEDEVPLSKETWKRYPSMRPRVFPAEDESRPSVELATDAPSMRPRVFPAEDQHVAWCNLLVGNPSMRPRVFPAEDPAASPPAGLAEPPFNEAAGIPRGRLGRAGANGLPGRDLQ